MKQSDLHAGKIKNITKRKENFNEKEIITLAVSKNNNYTIYQIFT